MSRTSVVTPSRPVGPAKFTPSFTLCWPPLTAIQPNRTSFILLLPMTRVWLATRFFVFVSSVRPKPGTIDSLVTLVPKGCVSSAPNVLKRAKSWSLSVSRWSMRRLSWFTSFVSSSAADRFCTLPAPVGIGVARSIAAAIGSIRPAGIWLFANGMQPDGVGSQIGPRPLKSPLRRAADGTENVRVCVRFSRWPS